MAPTSRGEASWSSIIEGLERRSSMYLLDGTYAETCAFLHGFSAGVGDNFLVEFNDWIRSEMRYQGGEGFLSLVAKDAVPSLKTSRHLNSAESDMARNRLFMLLHKFMSR